MSNELLNDFNAKDLNKISNDYNNRTIPNVYNGIMNICRRTAETTGNFTITLIPGHFQVGTRFFVREVCEMLENKGFNVSIIEKETTEFSKSAEIIISWMDIKQ